MKIRTLNHQDVLSILPDRAPDSYKGDYGKVLLLCGSRGYTGAAALAAMGALRSGAGLAYLAVPESIYIIEAVKLTETIVMPLPDRDGKLSEASVGEVRTLMEQKDVVLIGPGLGQSAGTFAVVKAVLEEFQGPVVLDADGINLIAAHKDLLRGRTGPTILTPHAGEFARIADACTGDRLVDSVAFASEYDVTLLLKGHRTIITDGNVAYINYTGNPGMAVGGSGDVLAGMIAGLLGQGLKPMEAASCGAWLHGAAGDICAQQLGMYGMLPSDMLSVLPRLLK